MMSFALVRSQIKSLHHSNPTFSQKPFSQGQIYRDCLVVTLGKFSSLTALQIHINILKDIDFPKELVRRLIKVRANHDKFDQKRDQIHAHRSHLNRCQL